MGNFALLILAIGLVIIGLGIVVALVRMLIKNSGKVELPGVTRQELVVRWSEIENLLLRNDEMSHKLALMEADKFFDHILKLKMFPGSTMGERMKIAGYKYSKMNEVWHAHILRNKMVHDEQFRLRADSARRSIAQYKAALKQMNIL